MPVLRGGHCGKRGHDYGESRGVEAVACDSEGIGEGDEADRAAEDLSLSIRQIRRLVKRVKGEGDRGIVHQSRGRPSNRSIEDKEKGGRLSYTRRDMRDLAPPWQRRSFWRGRGSR